jgi:ABC-2 type transport system permease protein
LKGLIIKDLLNLKKGIGTILYLIIIYSFFTYTTGNSGMIIGIIAFLMTSFTITSMSYDDMAKWDSYALAMPISRKNIVLSKYLLSLLLGIIGTILATICAFAIVYIKGDFWGVETILELLLTAYTVFAISIVYISIVIPLVYRFGVEKARILMVGSFILPTGIGYLLYKMGFRLPSIEVLKVMLYLSPLFLVLILILSSYIAYSIYNKKDI